MHMTLSVVNYYAFEREVSISDKIATVCNFTNSYCVNLTINIFKNPNRHVSLLYVSLTFS